jgi:hypothetical protein
MPHYRTSVALFAVAAAVAFILAAVTTLSHIDTREASNAPLPGTVGLARPHPPLDRAPGVPIQSPQTR